MSRFIDKSMRSAAILFVVCAALTITGCGGGGGGGGGAGVAATVTQTSFQGQPAVPGGDLPPIFRDESLLFTFSAPIDTTSFGGLRLDGMGAPAQFVGFSAAASTGVPYFAFDNQTAAAMAFQIYENTMGAMQHPGVLGVSSVNPNVLVFDPRLRPTNPFGLPTSLGFNANLRYTIFIPAAGGLIAGGQPVAAFGSLPPATVPVFTPSPIPGRVFRAGPGFSPDTVPPTIDAIESMFHIQNSLPPTDPIPHNDTIIVTFSEPVDPATVDRQKNVIVRNISVTTTTSPNGVIVPMTQTSDPSGQIYMLTPQGSFGAGPFQIRVEVGTNANIGDAIKDLPSGTSGSQNRLSNSRTVTFTTISAPGQLTTATFGEDFETTAQKDTTFTPIFNDADWNEPQPPLNQPSGQLRGLQISGTAFLPNLGTGNGARTQVSFRPNGGIPANCVCCTATCFFNAPFDTDVQNNGAAINPNGGSRLQLLYLQNGTELPTTLTDSIELMEWSPPSMSATAITYPGFTMKMGHSLAQATNTMSFGLVSVFDTNYDFSNPQNDWIMPVAHPDPANMNPNQSPVTVVPSQPYMVGQFTLSGLFIPFPPLVLPFDFNGNRTGSQAGLGNNVKPNLLMDVDIPPPVIEMNGFRNVCIGSNSSVAQPTRRAYGASGAGLASFNDPVIYHSRITIVKKNSSAQTLFYDLGAQAMMPDYLNLDLFPAIDTNPTSKFLTIQIEGADSVNGPVPTGSTGLRTYVTRSGTIQQAELDALDGKRFFRVRFLFEADIATNTVPFVNGFLVGYSFQ